MNVLDMSAKNMNKEILGQGKINGFNIFLLKTAIISTNNQFENSFFEKTSSELVILKKPVRKSNRTGRKSNQFESNRSKIKPVRIEPTEIQTRSNRTGRKSNRFDSNRSKFKTVRIEPVFSKNQFPTGFLNWSTSLIEDFKKKL